MKQIVKLHEKNLSSVQQDSVSLGQVAWLQRLQRASDPYSMKHDSKEVSEAETLVFNEYIDKFRHFYQDEDYLEEPGFEDPDLIDTVPLSDSVEGEAVPTSDSVTEADSDLD